MKAKDVMETEVLTVTPDMTVKEVAQYLYDNELSALPVVEDGGKIIGIVSEEDLIYRVSRPHIPPHIELLGGIIYLENPFEMKKELKKMSAVTAGEIMTTEVHSVAPDTDISEVAELMTEKDINGVPVVDNNKIVGIVTRHDLLKSLTR
ncbi:MAG: CBS domain-containing protein [Vulcanimicrobiota bacterium]